MVRTKQQTEPKEQPGQDLGTQYRALQVVMVHNSSCATYSRDIFTTAFWQGQIYP